MIQCGRCDDWFHLTCVGLNSTHLPMNGSVKLADHNWLTDVLHCLLFIIIIYS